MSRSDSEQVFHAGKEGCGEGGSLEVGCVLVWCQPVPGSQHLHSSLDIWCSAPNADILIEPQTTE